jgi:hypothetical protein
MTPDELPADMEGQANAELHAVTGPGYGLKMAAIRQRYERARAAAKAKREAS